MNSTNSEVHAGDYTADTYLLLFQANEKKEDERRVLQE